MPSVGKATKILRRLNPVPDEDGLLTAHGRITRAPIPERPRYPIILPKALLAGLTSQRLTDDSLNTLLCKVESILNNRPLTVVSTDPNDLEPLTPNHLLILSPATSLPGEFNEGDMYCRHRWRQVQYLADVFWKRWLKEYLPQLQKRSKWLWKERNMSEGDVVLLLDDLATRNSWKLGRVLEADTGKDGQVRSVRLKTKDTELTRPVHKLCCLEESIKKE